MEKLCLSLLVFVLMLPCLEAQLPPAEKRVVTRVADLRPEFLSPKSGFHKYGTVSIVNDNGSPRISYKALLGSGDSPNMVLSAEEDGSFGYGDFGYMTHLAYEIEGVSGFGGYLGLTFVDQNDVSLWHSLGAPATAYPIRDSQQLFGSGLNLAHLKKVTLSCGNAVYDHTYCIRKLQFEYRPEVLLAQAEKLFKTVERQSLNEAEADELTAIRKQLADRYAPVKGETFRYEEAMAFNSAITTAMKQAKELLRRHNERVLPAATAGRYGVGIADSMTSVFLEGPGSEMHPATEVTLELAGHEYESFQVVVLASTPLRNVSVTVSTLTGPNGALLTAEAALVGHAKTYRQNYPQEYIGFYPDFIISYQHTCDIAANETVPFWVRIHAPAQSPQGEYSGTVTVTADGEKPWSFPLKARVFGFTLPDSTPIPTAWHVNDWQMSRFYKLDDSPRKQELEEAFIDMNCRYRIMYDQIYWAPTVKDYRHSYFEKVKRVNDKYGLHHFTLFNLFLPNKWITNPNDERVTASVNEMLAALDKWVPVCKELGIWEKAVVYGFDEAKMDSVTQRYFDALKAKCPELRVMTTARYGDPAIPAVKNLDIWVPGAKLFINRPDLVAANRAAGKKVYWYICDYPRPPEPTFMLEVPAAVPRVFMGLMTAKYRPDGFLYWSNIYWRNKEKEIYRIINEGPRTDWETRGGHPTDSEEGNLFCPGRDCTVLPSIRVENYRDGVEDLWYWTLLEQARKSASPALAEKAAKALAAGNNLVQGSSNYTTDPVLIRAWRHAIAECLEEILR